MIYGIDMAMRRVVAVGKDGLVLYWSAGLTVPIAVLCAEAHDWAIALVQPGDTVSVEQPLVGGKRNLQSTIKVAMVTGAVMSGLKRAGAVVLPVAVSTWKKDICGHGGLGKPEVAQWVRENRPGVFDRLNAELPLKFLQDGCDASCIQLWAEAQVNRDLGV